MEATFGTPFLIAPPISHACFKEELRDKGRV
jgi:hypothetical protein